MLNTREVAYQKKDSNTIPRFDTYMTLEILNGKIFHFNRDKVYEIQI